MEFLKLLLGEDALKVLLAKGYKVDEKKVEMIVSKLSTTMLSKHSPEDIIEKVITK